MLYGRGHEETKMQRRARVLCPSLAPLIADRRSGVSAHTIPAADRMAERICKKVSAPHAEGR